MSVTKHTSYSVSDGGIIHISQPLKELLQYKHVKVQEDCLHDVFKVVKIYSLLNRMFPDSLYNWTIDYCIKCILML